MSLHNLSSGSWPGACQTESEFFCQLMCFLAIMATSFPPQSLNSQCTTLVRSPTAQSSTLQWTEGNLSSSPSALVRLVPEVYPLMFCTQALESHLVSCVFCGAARRGARPVRFSVFACAWVCLGVRGCAWFVLLGCVVYDVLWVWVF